MPLAGSFVEELCPLNRISVLRGTRAGTVRCVREHWRLQDRIDVLGAIGEETFTADETRRAVEVAQVKANRDNRSSDLRGFRTPFGFTDAERSSANHGVLPGELREAIQIESEEVEITAPVDNRVDAQKTTVRAASQDTTVSRRLGVVGMGFRGECEADRDLIGLHGLPIEMQAQR